MKKGTLYFFAFFLFLGSISCQKMKNHSNANQYTIKNTLQIIKSAKSAKVFHISPFKSTDYLEAESFHQYPILSGPVALYEEELLRFGEILNDTTNFGPKHEIKMCLFTPNIGISIQHNGKTQIDFLLSLDCNQIKILENGSVFMTKDFDPSREAIKDLFYPIFKEEPYFQALN